MGEDRTGRKSGHRVTVDEAARQLGLTVDAVRKRVQRGQIAYEKDEAGRVRIILDEYETLQDDSPDNAGRAIGGQGELVEELRDRVHYLERVLEEEREARTEERRRHDTLMAQLMQRIPELEAPSETRESPQPGEEVPEKAEAEPRPATGEPQEAERTPWWRRVFGS
jgi:excisionase family DNA binding protein